MGWPGLAPHPQSNIVRQLIGNVQALKPGAAGAAGVQRLAAQGGSDLQARDDEAAAARRGSGQGDQAGGLIVAADEDFLPCLHGGGAMGDEGAALDDAAKLAAGHHFLPRVAAFVKVHAAHAFVIEHLRHESACRGAGDAGHARQHFGGQPVVFRQGRGSRGARAGGSSASWGKGGRPLAAWPSGEAASAGAAA